MPALFNDVAEVLKAIVTNFRGVKVSQYRLSIKSCDSDELLPLTVFEDFYSNTILHPVGAFLRVRGVILPACVNSSPGDGMLVDANFGGIERLYNVRTPANVVFQVTGTVSGRYHDLEPCLILEVDKSFPSPWFMGYVICSSIQKLF